MSSGWDPDLPGGVDRSAETPATARDVVDDLRPGDEVVVLVNEGPFPDPDAETDAVEPEDEPEAEADAEDTEKIDLADLDPERDGVERVAGEVVDRAHHHGILELRVAAAERYRVVRPSPTVETVTVRRVESTTAEADPDAADAQAATDGGAPRWDGEWTQLGRVVGVAVDTSDRRSYPADPTGTPELDTDSMLVPDDLGESAD